MNEQVSERVPYNQSFYCKHNKKKMIIMSTAHGKMINDCFDCYKKKMHEEYDSREKCKLKHKR